MRSSEFVTFITRDQLAQIPGLSAKAMFGGFGLSRNGVMFGIVINDELYFKVEESTRSTYEAMGSAPFSYMRKDGKRVSMSYWKVPEEVLDDRTQLEAFALDAFEVAFRAQESKAKGKYAR